MKITIFTILALNTLSVFATDTICHELATPGAELKNSKSIKIKKSTSSTALSSAANPIKCELKHASNSILERRIPTDSLSLYSSDINTQICNIRVDTLYKHSEDKKQNENKLLTTEEVDQYIRNQMISSRIRCDSKINSMINSSQSQNYFFEKRNCERLQNLGNISLYTASGYSFNEAKRQSQIDFTNCMGVLNWRYPIEYNNDIHYRKACYKQAEKDLNDQFKPVGTRKTLNITLHQESIDSIICHQDFSNSEQELDFKKSNILNGNHGFILKL